MGIFFNYEINLPSDERVFIENFFYKILLKEYKIDDYYKYLKSVDIVGGLKGYLESDICGEYDPVTNKIKIKYLDDKNDLIKIIKHELTHVLFHKYNGGVETNTFVQEMAYSFINEYNAYFNQFVDEFILLKNNINYQNELINRIKEVLGSVFQVKKRESGIIKFKKIG